MEVLRVNKKAANYKLSAMEDQVVADREAGCFLELASSFAHMLSDPSLRGPRSRRNELLSRAVDDFMDIVSDLSTQSDTGTSNVLEWFIQLAN